MAKRCELTGVGPQTGNQVSHSHRCTKRRFVPNLQKVKLYSDFLRKAFSFRITVAALRSVDHNGGLDKFLLGTANTKLPLKAKTIKKKIQENVGKSEAAEAEKAAPVKKEKAKKRTSAKAAKKKTAPAKPVKAKSPKKTAKKKK